MGSPGQPYNMSLDHVPEDTQIALKALLAILHGHCKDIKQVWLFGSFARGDFIRDRRVDPETQVISEYRSDIDVMVICGKNYTPKKTNLWHKIEKAIEASDEIKDHVHLIRDPIDRVNDALNHSEYFYLDLVNEGILLYGEDVELAQPQQMSPATRREYAIRYLKEFYERANSFQTIFELSYRIKDHRITMFSLHQLAERLFYTFLLVHTHYKPRIHDLDSMRDQVAVMKKEIYDVFPTQTAEEKQHFQFLVDAYIDSRYKDKYTVDPNVLDALARQVQAFQAWTLCECLKCIDKFVPDKPYSQDYERPGTPLDLDTLKVTPLAEEIVEQQKQEIEAFLKELQNKERLLEEERQEKLAEREEKLAEREAKEQAIERELKERQEKEIAIKERDKERFEKEAERKEKQRLRQKLRDSGIDPDS